MIIVHIFLLLLFTLAINSTKAGNMGFHNITTDTTENVVPQDETEKPLQFASEPLGNVVTTLLSGAREVNIILPQGAAAMKEKVTFESKEPLGQAQRERLAVTLLDVAGYVMVQKDAALVIAVKNPESLREPFPLYVGTPPAELPDSDGFIRYIYYPSNIKVTNEPDSEIQIALRELSSPNGTFRLDSTANAIILIDKASNIKSTMQLIKQIDQPAYQEKLDFVHLHNADAQVVSDLLNEYILKIGAQENASRFNLDARKQTESLFFARGTKVIPLLHSNSLMILGRPQAVDRIKEFVEQSMDAGDTREGKSILHVYTLQYLNAEEFAPELQRIVESSRAGGTEQSQAQPGQTLVRGGERIFDEVIIRADKPADAEERNYYGGNNLIIAARNEDYQEIVKLIAQLDTPQPIVLLEILIADLSIDDTRTLGAITRNPDKIPILNTMQFQAAHLDPGVIVDDLNNPMTVAADLLRKSLDSSGKRAEEGVESIASLVPTGGAVISLNDRDGKTWSMLEVLKLFSHSEIISHPHVVTTNNKRALVKIGETRLLRDETTQASGGASIIQFKEIPADLVVEITPRISPDQTVNLQVKININNFIVNGQNAQTTREVSTTANIKTGDIFALGGLMSLVDSSSINKTPILADIPIIGWLFKKRNDQGGKKNLTVFISPTIIEPRLRRGVNQYTQDYIELTKKYSMESGLFDSIKDPISRWFFRSDLGDLDAAAAIDTMIAKDTRAKLAPQEIPAFELQNKPPIPERMPSGRSLQRDNIEIERPVELPIEQHNIPVQDPFTAADVKIVKQDVTVPEQAIDLQLKTTPPPKKRSLFKRKKKQPLPPEIVSKNDAKEVSVDDLKQLLQELENPFKMQADA